MPRDFNIYMDNVIEAQYTDIVLHKKLTRKWLIVNVAVPSDLRMHEKEQGKIEKYQEPTPESNPVLSQVDGDRHVFWSSLILL